MFCNNIKNYNLGEDAEGVDDEITFDFDGDVDKIFMDAGNSEELKTESALRKRLEKAAPSEISRWLRHCKQADRLNDSKEDILDHFMVQKQKKVENDLESKRLCKRCTLEGVEYSFDSNDTDAHTYFAYFRSRAKHSNLQKYFGGFVGSLSLTSEETDTAVNAVILLDALVLTIPFAILPNLGYAYWDWLKIEFASCSSYPEGWTAERWFEGWYTKLNSWLTSTIFCVVGAILLGIFYYTNRPRHNKKFRVWWVTGKYAFYTLNGLTIIGVIMLLTILGCMQIVYNVPSGKLCDTVSSEAYVIATGNSIGAKLQQFLCGASSIFVAVMVAGFILTI